MSESVLTAVHDDLIEAYRTLDRKEHDLLGRGLADRAWDDICHELPDYANATALCATEGTDPDQWLDRLGAAVLAAKASWRRAQSLRVDTGEDVAA